MLGSFDLIEEKVRGRECGKNRDVYVCERAVLSERRDPFTSGLIHVQ